MGRLLVITGTPGVGKSVLTKRLVKALGRGWKRVDLQDHYTEISVAYDQKKKCYDIDLNRLSKLVVRLKKESNVVIDSHLSHLLPKRQVDCCIVLLCSDLKMLKKRLQQRKYSKAKVEENLQAEIFQVCLDEAKERQKKVQVMDVARIPPDLMVRMAKKYYRQALSQK